MQAKQPEWNRQWELVAADEEFLFRDWIAPLTLEEDFKGKTVLEGGIGGGFHTEIVSRFAKKVVCVELNTLDIARKRVEHLDNVQLIEGDLAKIDLKEQFDIVYSVGVVHHTDDPRATFQNLAKHVKPGGVLAVWVYSKENNGMVEYGVEPIRKLFLKGLSGKRLMQISRAVCAAMYPPIHTVYRLPVKQLPFYEYFENFRKMSFTRNAYNIFDKLNAPQTQFISKPEIQSWFDSGDFEKVTISPYKGVSWTGVGYVSQANSSVS